MVFELTPGPVEPRHIRELVTAGRDHAIVIDVKDAVSIIRWTATTALADNFTHLPIWTWREYYGTFGHQNKLRLTQTWLARLAGIANRQFHAIASGQDWDTQQWLRFPMPADDPLERLAHIVAASQVRAIEDPELRKKVRSQVAVASPVGGSFERGRDLTFGDLDDLYRQLSSKDDN